tara:strand:+ start:1132 stop:1725 length:594 start_codon:yes stop_codon:yes gene_type:complete
MKDNMKIWKSVEKTNPKYTKAVNFGRKFTTINAQYQMMTATEQFGPYGKGWGVRNEEFKMICDGLLSYQADMFWRDEAGEVNHFSINSSIGTHSKAGKLDEDCYKKVSTDALTKGLSKLGFSADVFLGMWDDNKYVAQVKEEFSEKKKPSAKKKMTKEVMDAMMKAIKDGKSDVVKGRMSSYTMTKAQQDKLTKAIK